MHVKGPTGFSVRLQLEAGGKLSKIVLFLEFPLRMRSSSRQESAIFDSILRPARECGSSWYRALRSTSTLHIAVSLSFAATTASVVAV